MRHAGPIVTMVLWLLVASGLSAIDLSLDEAITMARANSHALERSQLAIEARRASLEQARADRLPEVTLRATSTYLTNPQEGISIQAGDFGYLADPGSTYPTPIPNTELVLLPDPLNTYFQIQANTLWPFFTWGKLEAAERVASLEIDVATVTSEQAEIDLVRDITRAYHGLRLARESVRVLSQIRSIYSEVVADRQRAFDAGAINLESVLDAQAQMGRIDAQWSAAAEGLRSAEAGVRYLTGFREEITPTDVWRESAGQLDVDAIVGVVQAWSPELRRLDLQVSQATVAAQIQKNSEPLRPNLALAVGVDLSGQRVPLSPNWREDWDLGVTVTLVADAVAWDWGKRQAATTEATLNSQIAGIGRDELASSIEVQVIRLVENALSAQAGVLEKRASVDLALEREKNARVSFENELITREQYLGAQILRLTAELDQVVAGFAVESALMDIEHLMGRRLD